MTLAVLSQALALVLDPYVLWVVVASAAFGLFVGADYVGADNVVKFAHNRKPWVALQIGFDFTDN